MAKATYTLPNGTVVTIEGSPDEVQKLLVSLSDTQTPTKPQVNVSKQDKQSTEKGEKIEVDIASIVNLIKTCPDAEAIEQTILDRTSLVDRILLPLYVIHEYSKKPYGLTSGHIAKVLSDLGVPIAQPNIAKSLSSTVSRYIVGDSVRKRGAAVVYKISRRGIQYLKNVITGITHGN